MTRITAARVLRPDGTLRPGTVTLDGATIAAVEDPSPGPPLQDVTLAPGLIDLQVNGFGDIDVWASDAGGLDRLGSVLAAHGTTGWCPTLVSRRLPDYAEWLAGHPHPAFGEIGLHLEGPFIARPGAHPRELLGPPDPGWLASLPARVRIITLAPELDGALDAIAALAASGTVVALGHSEATYDQARQAVAAGARLVTHVFNAMPSLGHREPGLAGAALTDEALTIGVIGDGVHVHPAVLGLVLRTGRAALVSDAVAWARPATPAGAGAETPAGAPPTPNPSPATPPPRPAGVPPTPSPSPGRPNPSPATPPPRPAGAARLPDGTLAGSVITLAEAVRIATVDAGVDLATALVAATATPARLLGLGDRGRLMPGARADLVAFDPDCRISGVWLGGRRVVPG